MISDGKKPGPQAPAPAQSALRVALRRAAHQLVDRPLVFHDAIAVRLLGPDHEEALRRTPVRRDRPWSTALRAFAVARSAFAEQQLAFAVANGTTQYCLLGAGLDTFGWRNPHPGLTTWEVDQPVMQAWKQSLAQAAELPLPSIETRHIFVAADLGAVELPALLSAAGMRGDRPAFFALLGVAPYLDIATFRRLLQLVLAHGPGSALVLDYRLPREALGPEEQRQHDSLAARVAAAGEPFRLGWTREEMADELCGFSQVEDLDTDAINARFFAERQDAFSARGAAVRLACAWV